MLILKEGEICPHGHRCQYADSCWGVRSERDGAFTCSFIKEDGTIQNNQARNPLDVTGKMKIIMENK